MRSNASAKVSSNGKPKSAANASHNALHGAGFHLGWLHTSSALRWPHVGSESWRHLRRFISVAERAGFARASASVMRPRAIVMLLADPAFATTARTAIR